MNKENRGVLFVLIAGALWGMIGLFVKQMEAGGANIETISLVRVTFACLIMLAVCIAKYGIGTLHVDWKILFVCALLGIICHGIYNIFYSAAVVKAGVAMSAILLDVAPVFTFGFSVILFHEKMSAKKLIGILVNVIGCILAVTNGNFGQQSFVLAGILYGIGAGICYSLTAIIGRYAGERTNPFIMSFYSYLFSSIFLAGYMMLTARQFVMNKAVLGVGFFYALIPTAIAYVFYYLGVQRMRDSSKVPVVASIEVIIACILGVICYGEKMGIGNVVGIILVVGSIGIMNWSRGKIGVKK